MIKRPFEQWLFEDVEIEFGIERVYDFFHLQKWLFVKEEYYLPKTIDKLRLELLNNVDTWILSDLQMFFIAPLFYHFEFYHFPNYRIYIDKINPNHSDTKWIIGTGKQRPKPPFFFIKVYTEQFDPLGQLLIAMVDAQLSNNEHNKPIYGCYNIGRLWFFVLLIDKEYGVSRAYDATQIDDLTDMVVILNRVVTHIKTELNVQD
jgi:hypothetical protein